MSPVTHFLIGWTVASAVPSLTSRDRALVTWASVAPDLDGVGILAEILTQHSAHPLNWFSEYHHLLGHNLGFALIVTAIALTIARQKIKTALLVFLSFHLHLLADLVGARGPDGDQWPIPYLLPFLNEPRLSWRGQWALNAWPNLLITAVLIAFALINAQRRGFSPIGLFSTTADSVFIRSLRGRFPIKVVPALENSCNR